MWAQNTSQELLGSNAEKIGKVLTTTKIYIFVQYFVNAANANGLF